MNKEKIKKFIAVMFVFFYAFSLTGCNKNALVAEVADDEIALQIKLNTKDDIGLLIIDYIASSSSGSGGISNANKTMLKHGEILTYTLNKQELNNVTDIENIIIQFTVITEYVDPNYENIYPLELTKPMDPISLKANYGESYFITISGDKTSGYKAVLS